MTRLTSEWVKLAEDDFAIATWLLETPIASPNAIGFHCQQCVEKYIKAWLIERNVAFQKTHDFAALHRLVSPLWDGLDSVIADVQLLQPYAVTARYPGFLASAEDAREALAICGRVRAIIAEDLARELGL